MRHNILKLKLGLILLFISISINSFSHNIDIDKYELFWKENNLLKMLKNQQTLLGLNQKEMNVFVFSSQDKISNTINRFWSSIREQDTSSAFFNTVLFEYKKNTNEIFESLIEFNNDKNSQNLSYQTLLKKFNSVLESFKTSSTSSSSLCHNPGFENNFDNWEVWLGDACLFDSEFGCNNFTASSYGLANTAGRLEYVTGGYDPTVGGTKLPMLCPTGGTKSIRLENTINGGNSVQLKYTFTVDPNKPIYTYKYALVMEEPTNPHLLEEKPYFRVSFFDKTDNVEIKCGEYFVYADADDVDFKNADIFMPITPGSSAKYTNWQSKSIDFIKMPNHEIEVTFTVSDCALGGHYGYVYLDGDCVNDPITVGPCLNDGSRELSVSGVFNEYQWKGNGIVGKNSENKVIVNQSGNYKLFRNFKSNFCKTVENINILSCPPPASPVPCQINIVSHQILPCNGNNNLFDLVLNFNVNNAPTPAVIKIQDGFISHFIYSPFNNPNQFTIPNLYADGKMHTIKISLFKNNYIADSAEICFQNLTIQAPEPCYIPMFGYNWCIGSFAPCPEATYVVSAWVRDPNAVPSTATFTNPHINLIYTGSSPNPPSIFASGKIIEGWQRIYYEFTIPLGTNELDIELNTLSGTAMFDDIRIYPLNASMKSYVYDPISLKLVAELDENNYATFYEYDQEGTLIRTKKETERGVMTITENRQSNPKR
jgi:hypothetical protein